MLRSRIRSELGRGKLPHPFLALSRPWARHQCVCNAVSSPAGGVDGRRAASTSSLFGCRLTKRLFRRSSAALSKRPAQPTCPGAPHDLLSPSGNELVVASGARTLNVGDACHAVVGQARHLAWPVWGPGSDGSHATFADSTWRAHPQVGADARCFFTANVCFRPEAWRIDESTIPRQRNSAGWMIGYIGR